VKVRDEQGTLVETDATGNVVAGDRGSKHVQLRSLWMQCAHKSGLVSRAITGFLADGKQKHSIAVLDGTRAVACLAIITFHMNLLARFHGIWDPNLQGVGAFVSAGLLFGESGVMLFFVLSGFLLFLPYAKSLLFDSRWPSLRRFYLRRIFRILPGYYVALCLMVLFVAPQYLQPQHLYELWLFITFRMDFPLTFQQLNAPFWTLAIEFQYYLFLPFLALLIALIVKHGSLTWRLCSLAVCLLLVISWGIVSRLWGMGLLTVSFVPPALQEVLQPYIYARAGKFYEDFGLGMLVCMLYCYLQNTPTNVYRTYALQIMSVVIFANGLVLLAFLTLWHFYMLYMGATLHFLDPYQGFLLAYRDLLQPLGYGLGYGCCVFALLHGPYWLRRPFEWRPLRWLGLLSYSLYMWHYLIIWHFIDTILPKFQLQGWSQLAQTGVYWLWLLLIAVPFSVILYKFVEIPGIRLGERLCRSLDQRRLPVDDAVSTELLPEPVTVTSTITAR
jgi:Predicted acyltransferases